MLIAKAEIHSLIPHGGAMCLVDSVKHWDDTSILCVSDSHRDPANPLRRDGRLAALHAFEYGAQAIAIHGGLLAGQARRRAPSGYLAALRDARLYVTCLDDIEASLEIEAKWLMGSDGSFIYRVWIGAEDRILAKGRIVIMGRSETMP